jgi:hypothetical protein
LPSGSAQAGGGGAEEREVFFILFAVLERSLIREDPLFLQERGAGVKISEKRRWGEVTAGGEFWEEKGNAQLIN